MVLIPKTLRAVLLAAVVTFGPALAGVGPQILTAGQAQAAVVNSIEVRGNSRMDAETIRTYVTIVPGQSFSNADIDDSVKALFSTGFFTDVSIYQSGRVLIVEVDESGVVANVFFEGNKRLKDEVLTGLVQTAPRTTYSEQKVLTDLERINEAYSRVGREDATVTYEVVPLANNRVNVVFRINEGDKTKISQIGFIGNNSYGERRLREVLAVKKSNIFSWLRNDDIYDPDKVRADEERLRQFYYNNGYADFQVLATDVTFDDASNSYVIVFNIDEGQRYRFGQINIDSTIRGVDPELLYSRLETVGGDYYSSRDVEDSIINLTEAVAAQGYAFVQVVPRGDRNFDDNTINVTYQIDEGARVYIQQINIVGNDRTREHVIRREFDISEGDPLNQIYLQRTKRRLEGLGFFESVDISTRQGDSPDRVIVTVRVVDKATGEFSIGGGYSTTSGPLAEISFSEKNFLGRGQYLKISGGIGTESETYTLSFTEPYFLGYRLSAGFDIVGSSYEATSNRQYDNDTLSGTLRFGLPITEKLNSVVYYSYSDEQTTVAASRLEPTSTADADAIQGNTAGELSAALARNFDWVKSGFGYSLVYNDLDNTRTPSEGVYLGMSQTFYGAGGNAAYVSTEATALVYHKLLEQADVVGMLRARGGGNVLFNGAGSYRTQDNFFQGSRHIRGFDSYGFGPRDPRTGDALGGLYYWNATAEVTFPMPYVPESLGIRGGFFADAGQLWGLDSGTRNAVIAATGTNAQLDDNTLRASVGASVIWASPFGPLRFDYAVPVSSASWDDLRQFSFGISTSF